MPDVRVTPQPWLWKPRTKPIRFIEIHATRGNTTPEKQMGAALNWVRSSGNNQGGWGASFSYVIGTDGSMGTVRGDDQMPTYSAGYGGPGSEWAIDEYGISYELAQSAAQEPFTDACLRRAAKEVAAKCMQYGIPPTFIEVWNQSGSVPTGLVRHDKCQNGVVLGKTDPGAQFDEGKFFALMRAETQESQGKEDDDMPILIRHLNDPAVYVTVFTEKGVFKMHVPNVRTFTALGFDAAKVRSLGPLEFNGFTTVPWMSRG